MPPAAEEVGCVPGVDVAWAGVDVTLQVGEDLPHVYPIMLGTPEATAATEQTGKFLRARVR